MNLALAVLAIAAGACRIRVNHLASAESMNTKKTSGIKAVSYTHLDVYKRQISSRTGTVTAADKEEMTDLSAFNSFHKLWGIA